MTLFPTLTVAVASALALASQIAVAQTPQPYAGLEARPIKALSERQISDLKAGRGMGFALAAELNGYPGPIHVLELGKSLQLSESQRAAVEKLFAAMKAEAIPLGEKLIDQERDLDRQFANGMVTEAGLATATRAIGLTQASLRAAHLKYHLATVKVLTPDQVRGYAELRGYRSATHPGHSGHSHDGHR